MCLAEESDWLKAIKGGFWGVLVDWDENDPCGNSYARRSAVAVTLAFAVIAVSLWHRCAAGSGSGGLRAAAHLFGLAVEDGYGN